MEVKNLACFENEKEDFTSRMLECDWGRREWAKSSAWDKTEISERKVIAKKFGPNHCSQGGKWGEKCNGIAIIKKTKGNY